MSDDKKPTAEEQAIEEVYGLIDKFLPFSVVTMLKRFGLKVDSWWMAEKIMGISQRYVERKIKEMQNERVER